MEVVVNGQVILEKKSLKKSIETSTGVDVSVDRVFVKVLNFDKLQNKLELSKGDVVCVPLKRLTDVPYKNKIEYSCFFTDIVYYITTEQPSDKTM